MRHGTWYLLGDSEYFAIVAANGGAVTTRNVQTITGTAYNYLHALYPPYSLRASTVQAYILYRFHAHTLGGFALRHGK